MPPNLVGISEERWREYQEMLGEAEIVSIGRFAGPEFPDGIDLCAYVGPGPLKGDLWGFFYSTEHVANVRNAEFVLIGEGWYLYHWLR